MTSPPAGAATSPRPGLPQPRLLTVAEYLELGEIEPGYTELVEGRVILSPSPEFDHNYVGDEVWLALRQQLPPHLLAITDMDVNLELAPPKAPGFVRRPDVLVVYREARERIRRERGILRASDVVIVVETLSPGSKRTDRVAKRHDYADAGIPHYWILDLDQPVSLLTCHLAGEFGYADGGEFTGTFRTADPFGFELDLDSLR